ncbi:MAG: hypothetical protein AAGA85_28585, partial [Bacteroidota bacterium]
TKPPHDPTLASPEPAAVPSRIGAVAWHFATSQSANSTHSLVSYGEVRACTSPLGGLRQRHTVGKTTQYRAGTTPLLTQSINVESFDRLRSSH